MAYTVSSIQLVVKMFIKVYRICQEALCDIGRYSTMANHGKL